MDVRNLIAGLPADINLEIFFRIPLTTLREVLGEQALEQENIRRLQLIVSRNRSTGLMVEGVSHDNDTRFLFLSSLLNVQETFGVGVLNWNVRLAGSSRGVVCYVVSVFNDDSVVVSLELHNPVYFNDWFGLPPTLVTPVAYENGGIRDIFAFSYLGNTEFYKVVHISQERETEVEIFRNHTNSWNRISPPWPCMLNNHISLVNEPREPLVLGERHVQFIVRDIGHFLVWRTDGDVSLTVGVIGFNFRTETFTLLMEFDHAIIHNHQPRLGIYNDKVVVREITDEGPEYHLIEELQETRTHATKLFIDEPLLCNLFQSPLQLITIVEYKESLTHII